MGEVFQNVKYWQWHMNIKKLKVVVFRQFFHYETHLADRIVQSLHSVSSPIRHSSLQGLIRLAHRS
jgi:hypothetical protein